MRILLTVTAGPHKGLEFAFDRHDTFLVGRSKHAHFQLPAKDKFFSRIHFMMEVNPPQCRLIDMGSHNGTYLNGEKVLTADLKEGDQIRAGHTTLRVKVEHDLSPHSMPTISFPGHAPAGAPLPTVPGYQLERELGRGAMGVTYLGHRINDPVPRAMKVVQPSFQGSPAQIDAFLQATRRLTQLDHPHLVRLRDIGSGPDGFFFVADYVAGLNLTQRLERDGPLPVRRAVSLANQMLQALHYAHARQFIHRDLKPSNVLIEETAGKDVVRLADFGVAHVYQSAPFSGLTLTAALVHFASFMPPEVLFNYQEAHPLADQYSAAALLYYLLTGQMVLDLPQPAQQRYSSLLRRSFVPIRERREDVPPALADVLQRALARTPSQRFGSIAEFRQALLRAVQSE